MAEPTEYLPELGVIPWFTHFMGLRNEGLTPTVCPTELLPSRAEMDEFWGPRTSTGWAFDNHGNEDYEIYVRELYTRVMQLNWPVSQVMQFHFARALVAEAKGQDINWAEFAYLKTHPHQSHSGIPRILPEFVDIAVPLKPLAKVLPFPETEVRFTLSMLSV